MAYPNLQIPHYYVAWDSYLGFILQTTQEEVPISIGIYGVADTSFASPHYTDATQETDEFGDYTGSIEVLEDDLDSIAEYVLRVRVNPGDSIEEVYTKKFMVTPIGNHLALLSGILGSLMNLPRVDEQPVLSQARTSVLWGYGNWNLAPAPIVIQNDSTQLDGTGIKLDYATGKGYLTSAAAAGTEFMGRYNFAYLDDFTLYTFLRTTLGEINAKPPGTGYSLSVHPYGWEALFVLGSYIKSLKKLLLDLGLFQWRRVFEDPVGLASQASSLLAAASAEYTTLLQYYKNRSLVAPAVVRGNDLTRMPATITATNWRDYTILA